MRKIYVCTLLTCRIINNIYACPCFQARIGRRRRDPPSPMMMGATTCFPNNDALLIHDIDMGWPQNNY